MVTYEQWETALSNEAASGVFAEFDGAKNKNVCVDMIRWCVASGRAWRTKDGFHMVRGSVKGRPDGLKEDPFLQSLGITQGKIRGFIKQALNRGVIEILTAPPTADESGRFWRFNRNGRPRNPPVVYRFTEAFLRILRRGQKAKESGMKVALQPLDEPLSFSSQLTPNAQVSQDISKGSGGYLGLEPTSVPVPPPRVVPRIPVPKLPTKPVAPLGPQPAPSTPVQPKQPLTGKLAHLFEQWEKDIKSGKDTILSKPACVQNPRNLLYQTKAEYRAAATAPLASAWTPEDREFMADYPEVVAVSVETWPQVFDDTLEISKAVTKWLLAHVGHRKFHVRWCQQPGVGTVMRDLAPWDLKHGFGVDRVLHIGFRDSEMAVAFRMTFGGVPGGLSG